MHQFSQITDKVLNRLSRTITSTETKIKEATEEKDKSWDQVLTLFKEFDRDNPRFIASDGMFFARQTRQGAPKLDAQKLKLLIEGKYPPAKAKRLWDSICTQTVNSTLLEIMVQKGQIDGALVSECIVVPGPTFARIHDAWTKDDENRAVVLGIKRESE